MLHIFDTASVDPCLFSGAKGLILYIRINELANMFAFVRMIHYLEIGLVYNVTPQYESRSPYRASSAGTVYMFHVAK